MANRSLILGLTTTLLFAAAGNGQTATAGSLTLLAAQTAESDAADEASGQMWNETQANVLKHMSALQAKIDADAKKSKDKAPSADATELAAVRSLWSTA